MYSSTNIEPSSLTSASRSTSGSTTIPRSAFSRRITPAISVRFSGSGSGADRLHVDQRQRQHLLDVALVVRLARNDVTDAVDFGIGEILLLGHRKHTLALGVAQKLTLAVEQLQGVPLARVVRCGDDDAAVGLVRDDGHLDPRRGAQADVYHIRTARQQGAFDQVGDHLARNPGVAADNYGKFFARIAAGGETGVGRGELHHVGRRQVPGLGPSHGAPDAGNGFNQCHISRL